MSEYHITRRDDGWAAQKSGSSRAASLHSTQADAIDAGRGYLQNQGGGELVIHGRDNRIRAKDTIAPGNDPRTIPG